MILNENENTDNHLSELLEMTQIGTWDWQIEAETKLERIKYSKSWAKILGYTLEELPQTIETLQNIIYQEDVGYVNQQIQNHLIGETSIYEAEFRMMRKDGEIIWVQDKGKVTAFGEDGEPIRFLGVISDVTRIKKAEEKSREHEKALDIAVSVGGLGTCDWNIPKNKVSYNKEFLQMLGYTQNEIKGVVEEWEALIHPEDLVRSFEVLDAYLKGELPKYECEIRMKHKDGRLIWVRNVAQIVERDVDGNPVRLIGGHLNIDALKRSEEGFSKMLKELEHNREYLESEIENRTKALTEQDEMLWAVNDIAKGLFSLENIEDIDEVIKSSIERYCDATGRERISLWKNTTIGEKPYCSLLYEFNNYHKKEFLGLNFSDLLNTEKLRTILDNLEEDLAEEISEDILNCLLNSANQGAIAYSQYFPSIHNQFIKGKSLNSLASNLSGFEQFHMKLRGVKAFVVTPIILNDKVWGFIGAENCESEELFSEVEEKMLSIVGFFLANFIQKNESEKKMREAEERIQLMLDATPLCCNLWTPEFKNMTCNEEAVRLFELSSQQEYLDRFFELSPEYQTCGRLSSEMAVGYITKAFEEGFCKFTWMHQKLDGTPIPSEITLVRVRYKEGYIVAGYTRDLREFNAMLAKLQAKEDALRAAMDEALLSSKAKSNFLANMSHEIRTPMNAISGFAEIILRESMEKQSVEYAVGIKNACSNLLNIVNDILDISKIESGKLEIIDSQYELSSLLNDVIAISRMRLGKKSLMFVTNIDSTLPNKLIGDEIRIKQILINLLSNAIKFTENGYISLRVSGEKKGSKYKLCFDVEDSGFGIKKEDLERLFAEFERVNTTKNRSIEGTGLGLAISKQLCEMMDGEINVESTYGKGSKFSICIMQECPEYEYISKVTNTKNVLIYESREVYLKSISETIENLGCKCVSCTNQSELNENINKLDYDAIITSSMHLKKIKSVVEKNKIKTVIAVCADYVENIRDTSVYTLILPVNCLQMADMLNGEKPDEEFSSSNRTSYRFIAPTARVLVVDDNPVNLNVALGLMSPYQFSIDTAENGLEAIEMIKNNRYDLIFMDHMMPEMDGVDATIEIRKLDGEYFQKIPIVALTANALVGTKEIFIREGMNDFLAKPVEISKLGHILAKWIPISKQIAITNEKQEVLEKEIIEFEIFGVDTVQGILSVGGSKEDYLQILSSYYQDCKNKCISLVKHFSNSNILAFKTEVHAIKSTSATIGAVELSTMAAKLETAAINSDLEYIKLNFNDFIVYLKNILDKIAPIINNVQNDQQKKEKSEKLNVGEISFLSTELDKMYNAAEIANIGKIEEMLDNLAIFSWSENIVNEFSKIKKYSRIFDYDGVLECIDIIRKMIQE